MRIPVAAALLLVLRSAGPAHAAAPVEHVIADVRAATVLYLDVARAREDGFVQVSGMEPGHGYHFVNPAAQLFTATTALASRTLDLGRPSVLLYVERDGAWQLLGVEYALPAMPAINPLPGAEWRAHAASCHYRDHSARATAVAMGVLSALGGAALFYHDHEGGVHLDRVFLQHAAIGFAGIVVAGVFVAVGCRPPRAWPAGRGRRRWRRSACSCSSTSSDATGRTSTR